MSKNSSCCEHLSLFSLFSSGILSPKNPSDLMYWSNRAEIFPKWVLTYEATFYCCHLQEIEYFMSYESYAILRPFFSVFSDIFVNYDPNRHAIANSYNRKLKQVISMGPKKRKTSIFTFCGSDGFFTRSDVFSKYDYVIQHGGGHNGNHVLCFCIPILHMHTSNIFKYQPKRTKTEQMRVVSVQLQNP